MRFAIAAVCALTLLAGPALADPHKDESGKGRWGDDRGHREFNMERGPDRDRGYNRGRGFDRDREYNRDREYSRDRGYDRGRGSYGMDRERKQEFWDGNCKVERKWERNGEYKEERKCKGGW